MTRREALAALMALPPTARITRAEVQPDDVIVIECEQRLTDEHRERIARVLGAAVWPRHRIVVLDGGMTLKIASAKR